VPEGGGLRPFDDRVEELDARPLNADTIAERLSEPDLDRREQHLDRIVERAGSEPAVRRALEELVVQEVDPELAWSARMALRLVEALVAGDADEDGEQRSVEAAVFSDGSFPERGHALAGATLRYERVGPETPGENAGVASLAASRDHRDPTTARLFVRLVGNRAATVPATLSLDGRPSARTAIELTASDNGGGSEGLHTFEFDAPGGGVAVVSIERDAALASDDSAAVVLRPPARPRILSVVLDEAWRSRVGARVLSETP